MGIFIPTSSKFSFYLTRISIAVKEERLTAQDGFIDTEDGLCDALLAGSGLFQDGETVGDVVISASL
jgi:hypothetical protein